MKYLVMGSTQTVEENHLRRLVTYNRKEYISERVHQFVFLGSTKRGRRKRRIRAQSKNNKRKPKVLLTASQNMYRENRKSEYVRLLFDPPPTLKTTNKETLEVWIINILTLCHEEKRNGTTG